MTLFVKEMLIANANAHVSGSENKERREKSRKQETTKKRDCAVRQKELEISERRKKQETEIDKETQLLLDKERSKNFRTRQKDPESELKKKINEGALNN